MKWFNYIILKVFFTWRIVVKRIYILKRLKEVIKIIKKWKGKSNVPFTLFVRNTRQQIMSMTQSWSDSDGINVLYHKNCNWSTQNMLDDEFRATNECQYEWQEQTTCSCCKYNCCNNVINKGNVFGYIVFAQ